MTISISKESVSKPVYQVFEEPQLDFHTNSRKIQNPITGLQNFGPFDYNADIREFNEINLILLVKNEFEVKKNTELFCKHIKNGVN